MEIKKTITSIFIVPTLSIGKEKLVDNGFINGYIKDGGREVQYDYSIYILFIPENLDKFKEFLDEEYERTKSIIDDYDYEDGYVVVVYKLNSKWKKDFDLIKEGLYSRTSKEFQNTFPKIINVSTEKGGSKQSPALQHRIFSRSSQLIEFWEEKLDVKFTEDMEVWDGFDFKKEILDLDIIKQEEEKHEK
jgi:hypothetical protein